MAIPRINGLSSKYTQDLYSKIKENKKGTEYRIDPHQKEVLISEIMNKVKAGIISDSEAQQQIEKIKSAPEVFHVDEGSYLPQSSHLPNEDNTTTIQELEEKQRKRDIERLETDYRNGDISEFTYKVNMYFLSNPSSNDDGHSLNIMA